MTTFHNKCTAQNQSTPPIFFQYIYLHVLALPQTYPTSHVPIHRPYSTLPKPAHLLIYSTDQKKRISPPLKACIHTSYLSTLSTLYYSSLHSLAPQNFSPPPSVQSIPIKLFPLQLNPPTRLSKAKPISTPSYNQSSKPPDNYLSDSLPLHSLARSLNRRLYKKPRQSVIIIIDSECSHSHSHSHFTPAPAPALYPHSILHTPHPFGTSITPTPMRFEVPPASSRL